MGVLIGKDYPSTAKWIVTVNQSHITKNVVIALYYILGGYFAQNQQGNFYFVCPVDFYHLAHLGLW